MRGQVSIEVLLTFIVAVMAVSSFSFVGQETSNLERDASIRHQLDGIGTGLAAFISKTALLNDAASGQASVSAEIPRISAIGIDTPESCTISIGTGPNNDQITLTHAATSVSVTKRFVPPAGMNVPGSASCGSTFTVTRS